MQAYAPDVSVPESRRSRDMDVELRRGTRGEPGGRPIPTELELREAAERARRGRGAHREEPSVWSRFTHSLAGKVLHIHR